MVTGIALCIAAGAIWALGGIMNSRCASLHLDIVTYLLSNVIFAMDALAHYNLSGIAFALAIGASMVGFTVYSLLNLKEKCSPSLLAGLFGIIAGGILISGTFS